MEFFNKKEEVLDIQLTEYGKYLLSQGRMKPVFYAFYDDDILYDISSSGDNNEPQKDADRRIRYETPSLKVQANTTGAETRVKKFQKSVVKNTKNSGFNVNLGDLSDALRDTPQFEQKFFVASDPLGTSDLKTQYAPAWNLEFIRNEISSSADYYTANLTSSAATLNDGIIKEIPQIDIILDYKMFYTEDTRTASNTNILSTLNTQGLNVALEKNYIVVDILEQNTNDEKDNFYIEVYESGSDAGLQQLHFRDEVFADITEDNAEYYLHLAADDNIPLEVMREIGEARFLEDSNRLELNTDIYERPAVVDEEDCD